MIQPRPPSHFWKRLSVFNARIQTQPAALSRVGLPIHNFRKTRPRIRLLGLIRVGLVALVVSTAAFGLRIHAAQAALHSKLAGLLPSAEIAFKPWLPAKGGMPSAVVDLNGTRVSLRFRKEKQSSAALQRSFRESCPSALLLEGSIFDSSSGTKATATTLDVAPAPPSFTGGCLKDDKGQPISLLNWASHPQELGILSATILFSQEIEPSYALDGEKNASRVLELDMSLEKILRAFPDQGDAPGFDPSFAPRPSGRRLLSVRLETPSSWSELAFAYETKTAPEEAFAEYSRTLETHGIHQVRDAQGKRGGMFRKGDVWIAITATPNHRGSFITLVRLL